MNALAGGPRGTRARLALAGVVLLAAAWGVARAQPEEQGTASLRLLHLSPDAPLVDVLIDGRLALRDVGRRARSGYVEVAAGRHEVRVYPHRLPDAGGDEVPEAPPTPPPEDVAPSAAEGASPGADEPEVRARPLEPIVALVDLAEGSYTTLVLTGNFEPPTSEGGLGHLSIAVEPPEAQVTVQGPQGYLVQRPGDQWLTELEPGVYRIEVRREGYEPAQYEVEVQPDSTAVVTTTLQAASGEGTDAEPLPTSPGAARTRWRRLELQPYGGPLPLPRAGRALVRFVHAAPTVPGLGVLARPAAEGEGGEAPSDRPLPALRIDALAYPNDSGYEPLLGGAYRLEFRIAGTASVLHALPEVRLRPGLAYTLYLAADPAGGWIEVVPVVDGMIPQRPLAEGAP